MNLLLIIFILIIILIIYLIINRYIIKVSSNIENIADEYIEKFIDY